MEGLKLKEHSLLYFLSKAFPAAFTFLGIVLFVRIAGKEEYGKYSLLISMILFLLAFTSGWISQVILRFHSLYCHTREKLSYAKAVTLSSLLSAAVGVAMVCVSIGMLREAPEHTLPLSIAVYVIAFSYTLKTTRLQVGLRPGGIVLNEIVRSALVIAVPLCLFLLFGSMDSLSMLLGTAVAYLSALLLRSGGLRMGDFHKVLFSKTRGLKPYLIEYGRYGVPLSLWLAVAYLLNVSDRYLIAHFTNYESVGIYSAVYDLVYKSFSLAFFPVLMAAHPLIMNNWAKNKGESMRILKKSMRYQALIFPIVLAGLVILSPLLSASLKIERHLILEIGLPVAIGAFLWQFSMLLHKPMELHKKTMPMLAFVSLALLVNVLGNIIFMPRFGFIVAAYTTLAGACTYALLVTISYLRLSPL
jgi:O-antigen/teichoic acid export membrane protein